MLTYFKAVLGNYKKHTLLSCLFSVLEVMTELTIPLFMSIIVDGGLYRADDFLLKELFPPELVANRNRFVFVVAILMISASLLALFFGIMSARLAAFASQGFAKNMRKAMLAKIQDFSFANIDKFSTASLITRSTTDINTVRDTFYRILRMFVRQPIMLVIASLMAFAIEPKLASTFLFAMPVLALILLLMLKKGKPRFRRMLKKTDAMNHYVQENLTNNKVVKAYVHGNYESEKFAGVTEELLQAQFASERLFNATGPISLVIMWTCSVLILLFGGRDILFQQSGLLKGQLISIVTYVSTSVGAMTSMTWVIMMISRAQASLVRINEVLAEKADIVDGAFTGAPKDGSIEFSHVNFSYAGDPDNLALEDVSFKIKSGETIGVIGGTGSGKSTLVNLIPRFYDVLSGSVKVGGRDVRAYTLSQLRSEVSMVLQNGTLFSGTVAENLRWGDAEATQTELEAACDIAAAAEFVQNMPQGYESLLEQNAANLSGGQKQRLRLARALVKKPKILIMDDATSAVDMNTDEHIRKKLRQSLPDTTKIIIAQRIASVVNADRTMVIFEGKIKDFGTHEELMQKSEIYQDIYNSQIRGESYAEG